MSAPLREDLEDDELTERQESILDCIEEAIAVRGEAPSLRQISRHAGMKSISGVHYQLGELERKGVIVRDPHMPRAIRVLRPRGRYALLRRARRGTPT